MGKTEDSHSSFLSYLFNEELYIIPENITHSVSNNDQSFQKDIKNQVLIVMKEIEGGTIPDEDREFMLKILQSVGLAWEDVQIIQDKQYARNKALEVDYLVMWGLGLAPQDIGLDPKNRPYQIINQERKKILLTDPLEEIKTDVNKKKQLWH